MRIIHTPITQSCIGTLNKGDTVFLNGIIYTARDAAHKKMLEHLQKTGEMLLKGQTLYYAGPCPAKPDEIIGSVGPTTSYRMDSFTPIFLANGILATIGKGKRSKKTLDAIHKYGGIHFDAIGGAGAFYKNCVEQAEIAFFPELGAEAIYKLTLTNFPCIVAVL